MIALRQNMNTKCKRPHLPASKNEKKTMICITRLTA